jgi:hypothetical protein
MAWKEFADIAIRRVWCGNALESQIMMDGNAINFHRNLRVGYERGKLRTKREKIFPAIIIKRFLP